MKDRAKSIFLTAGAYSKAARTINVASQNDPILLVPSQVNAALTLELYFKSLYYLNNNQDFKVDGRHSHDFHKLFKSLPEDIKEKMILEFDEKIKNRDMADVIEIESVSKVNVPRDLIGNLESWSDVFTKVRYLYDKPKKSVTMMFFLEIEAIVKSTILSMKPEWQP